MEFKTAEERVLWELDQAENKIEELKDQNTGLSAKLEYVSKKFAEVESILRKYLKKDNLYFSMYVNTYVYTDKEQDIKKKELDILSKYAQDITDTNKTEVK